MRGAGRNITAQDEELIELVKEHPLLYDPDDARYTDSKAREEVWSHIGKTLAKSPSLCKSRWTNLRDNYRKYLRKRLTNSRVTNRYDDILGSFLKPCIKLAHTDENGELLNPFELCNIETKEEMVDDDDNLNYNYDAYGMQNEMDSNKRKYSQAFYQQYPSPMVDVNDPVDAFLAGISATLKTFSPIHQNMIKTKIFNMVQEFELEHVLKDVKEKENSDSEVT